MNASSKGRWPWVAAGVVAAAAAGAAWWWQQQSNGKLPEGIAGGNGRIEATEIAIAARSPGRLAEVLVREGDDVAAGQVVARIDVASLQADLDRARTGVTQARQARDTAQAMVRMREQAVRTAQAQLAQRRSDLSLADKELQRVRQLVAQNFLSPQKLDEAQAARAASQAGVAAAQSQILEAQAALAAAQSQVVEAASAIEAAEAGVARLQADVGDATLRAPRPGRVQVRAANEGEVVAAGTRILSLADLGDVHMTFFLPETAAGRLAIGAPVRLVLDAAPQYVIPASVSFVASVAQFTPKTVETQSERQKMVFKVRARIDPELLLRYRNHVKTGLPGMAYVQVSPDVAWPQWLQVKLPPLSDPPAPATSATSGAAPASPAAPSAPPATR
ncbi:MAG: HlyD family efflux transporter periplasmic adaptor subunit [Burkholderiales bacterium]|nr:HlyD family efflux transporter periplasmic adaptor subunit [Burkholderiales bacterium]